MYCTIVYSILLGRIGGVECVRALCFLTVAVLRQRYEIGAINSKIGERPSRPTRIPASHGESMKGCTHTAHIRDVTPSALGCEECLKTGSAWVHLRLCRTCGHVGCCDSSPNRH